jgi:hypothetical protein
VQNPLKLRRKDNWDEREVEWFFLV